MTPEGPDFWDVLWGYGGTSYKTIAAAMDKARTDYGVKKVIFDISTPGGTVDGADSVWQAHMALRSEKPTEAHVSSLLASGGYWIMSPAGKILSTSPTDMIGSIGVVVVTYDWTESDKKMGLKEITIVSKNAPNKRPDPATKEGRDVIQDQLDAIERIFYSRISAGRGVTSAHIAEHFGQGGLLVAADPSEANDAIKANMIDGLISGTTIGTFDISESRTFFVPAAIGGTFNANAEYPAVPNTVTTPPSGGSTIPAQAGTKQEGQNMDLSELLKANPSAAAELDRLKADAKAEGRKEATAEAQELQAKCATYLGSPAYAKKQALSGLIADVLTGKKSVDTLDAVVTILDQQEESEKSKEAQDESSALGPVPAQAPDGKSGDEKAIEAASADILAKAKAQQEGVKKWL
ncbi:S49 family peptidase [Treponema primitia]|uniref:S49 family peptidase n=1 Tax=Treponema primitia TaxID=88058 RepID=UPI0039802A8A